jgi:mannose-6-phosphate isomerase-like protein (cupin superfamily)
MTLAHSFSPPRPRRDVERLARATTSCHVGGRLRLVTFEIEGVLGGPGRIQSARLEGEARFVLAHARFASLGEIADALADLVLLPNAEDSVRPLLSRAVARASEASTHETSQTERLFGEKSYVVEEKGFGFVDVVYENAHSGVYRERIRPHTVLPTHVHHHLDEAELVLGSGFLVQGQRVLPGAAFEWPRTFPHRWENTTPVEQSFLCIDRPAFIPTDEVEVDLPIGALGFSSVSRFF